MTSHIWHSPFPSFAQAPGFFDEEILASAIAQPGRVAACDAGSGRRITYGQLSDGAGRLAAGLSERGIGRGSVVAIVAANHPDVFVAAFGVLMAGAAVATANPALTAPELRRQLLLTGAEMVIADRYSRAAVSEAITRLGAVVPVYTIDGEDRSRTLPSLLRSPGGPAVPRSTSDVAFLFPSGGTTGLPKIAAHTHAASVAWLQAFARTPTMRFDPTDVTVIVAPFTHMFGLGVAAHAMRGGAAVVSRGVPGFELEGYLRMLADHRATVTSATPTVALALARHPLVDRFDLSSLRMVIVGAAPTAPEVQDELAERLGCEVLDVLGTTEAWAFGPPADPPVRGSVGVVGANMEAMLIDVDTGEPVGPDEPGELLVRGPQVMAGYLGDGEGSAPAIDGEGWLHTGDLCSIDIAGNIFILDRIKEMIKVGGASVAPAEVERELLSHPDVVDAAVVGRPDLQLGEVPVAYISLRDDSRVSELLNGWFDGRLASWKHPRDVIVVDAVPRTPTGKLARRELIARERGALADV